MWVSFCYFYATISTNNSGKPITISFNFAGESVQTVLRGNVSTPASTVLVKRFDNATPAVRELLLSTLTMHVAAQPDEQLFSTVGSNTNDTQIATVRGRPTSASSSSSSSPSPLTSLFNQESKSVHSPASLPPPNVSSSSSISTPSRTGLPTTTTTAPASTTTSPHSLPSPQAICSHCAFNPAVLHCDPCNAIFCQGCFQVKHKAPSRRDHPTRPLPPSTPSGMTVSPSASNGTSSTGGRRLAPLDTSAPSTTPEVPPCSHCETNPAEVACVVCERIFCGTCNTLKHKAPARRDHARLPIAELFAPPTPHAPTPSAGWAGLVPPGTNPEAAAAAAVAAATAVVKRRSITGDTLLASSTAAVSSLATSSATASSNTGNRSNVPSTASTSSTSPSSRPVCSHCQENAAIVKCNDCDRPYCSQCNDVLHRAPRRRTHIRVDI